MWLLPGFFSYVVECPSLKDLKWVE